MPDDETIIAALLRELASYEAKGDEVNAQGVKDELKRMGWKPAPPSKRAEQRKEA
jgi:hypothetical protein